MGIIIGVQARGLGGCRPLRFGHCQLIQARFPFFRQKSHNLGSERKSTAILDIIYCQLILFYTHFDVILVLHKIYNKCSFVEGMA